MSEKLQHRVIHQGQERVITGTAKEIEESLEALKDAPKTEAKAKVVVKKGA